MCQAITDAFGALSARAPRNLTVPHSPLLKPFAIRYWARTMRATAGELCFAGHTRHADAEMCSLADDIKARIPCSPALAELLCADIAAG